MRPSIPTLLLALIPVALPPACGVEEAEAAETTVSLDPVAKMRAGIEELMDEPELGVERMTVEQILIGIEK